MKKIIFLSFTLFFGGFWQVQAQTTNEAFKPTLKINGRIQYDFEFLKKEKSTDWFNGNEFRRLHLSIAGRVAKHIKYKVETDFAHASIGFRDVYLKYTAGKYGNFSLGSVAEPTGLDMLTSSKYIPFFERAMLTSLQNFRWGSGFHYENFKLLSGKAGFQLAYTNNAVNGDGFKDTNLEKGMNLVVRATGTPIQDIAKHQVLHVGINFANRPEKDLSFRPENHMGGKYTYEFEGADTRSELGFELGTTFGQVSVQGEYKTQSDYASGKDYQMTSYYAFASYFLTGEYRPYKHGAFGRVKPKKDIDHGGMGAVEILARYSNMSASDDVIADNVGSAEQVNTITAGLNWYLNSHTRFMYNYVLTDDGDEVLGNMTGHLFRFQLDF